MSGLRALYYPFAHPAEDATLKRAVVLFDQVCFVDMSSPRVRAGGAPAEEIPPDTAVDWDTIRREHGALLERDIAAVVDPEPLIARYDSVLGAALEADLRDDETWRVCTAAGTPDAMLLLRRLVPPSAHEFLNSQTYGRLNYGTARARALFHGIYMDWPDLRGEIDEGAGELFPDDLPPGGDWYRFLFHDGFIAREGSSYSFDDDAERAAFMDVEHVCVFPYTQASALLVDIATIVARELDALLYGDSPHHAALLDLKRRRADGGGSHDVSAALPDLPRELLDPLDIEQTLRYRDALQPPLTVWKASLRQLLRAAEDDVAEVLDSSVQPCARRLGELAPAVYADLFGPASVGSSPEFLSLVRVADPGR